MEYLRIYGRKPGNTEEKLLFASLPETRINTAKKTAAENGYTISKIISIASHKNGYTDQDVTRKYIDA